MKQLLQLHPRPDGVFCCNDAIAIGAMRAIFEAGLKISKDIAIVGCGNTHYDDLLRVRLTSVERGIQMKKYNFTSCLLTVSF